MMNDEMLYEDIIKDSFGFTIDTIWDDLQYNHSYFSYKERVEKFSYILEKAMGKGILKLANEGEFLEGSIKDQAKKFKNSFPDDEKNMDEYIFGLDVNQKFWTPVGGVWICNDGDEIWT